MSSTDQSMYLVQPSNVNDRNFKNTNSNYKIRLTNRLSLNSGKWQIALVDCHYINNWDNVTEGKITVRQTYDDVVNTDGAPTAKDQLAMSTVYNCNVRMGGYEKSPVWCKRLATVSKNQTWTTTFLLCTTELETCFF